MNLALYAPLYVTVNGTLLLQELSFVMNRTTNSQPVATVALGYAGESPGAAMADIDVDNAVPAAGIEFDAGNFMAALIPVEVACIGPGGKQCAVKGFIIKDTIKHSVNNPSQYTFTLRAAMAQFQ